MDVAFQENAITVAIGVPPQDRDGRYIAYWSGITQTKTETI